MTQPKRSWHIDANLIDDFLRSLHGESLERTVAALEMLETTGPQLGRPLVDRVKGSAYHNMKELRPTSKRDDAIRILFVFDPHSRAILLVAGDKSKDWDGWYREHIPRADEAYTQHLANLKKN